MTRPNPLLAWKLVATVVLVAATLRQLVAPTASVFDADPMGGVARSLRELAAPAQRPRLLLLGNSLYAYAFDDMGWVRALVAEATARHGLPAMDVELVHAPYLCFARLEPLFPEIEAANITAVAVQLELLVPVYDDPCGEPRWTNHFPDRVTRERTDGDLAWARRAWGGASEQGPSLDAGRSLLGRLASRGVAVRVMEIPLGPTALEALGVERRARRRAAAAPYPLVLFRGVARDEWTLDYVHLNGAGRAAIAPRLIEALIASLDAP